jgi:DNA-binding response OmpR family regulator
MKNHHVLFADGDKAITDSLAPFLERAGYIITSTYDGLTALSLIHEKHPDLIVLDVFLPYMNGREICRQLRLIGNVTPIIMLSTIKEIGEKVMSLEEGADDYLCKPFEPQELAARINAVFRRTQNAPIRRIVSETDRLKSNNLLLDRKMHRIEINNKPISITRKAYNLLELLMCHPGEIFTREQLLDQVWGWAWPVNSRVVDVRIAELRRVFEENGEKTHFIETVVGVGYQFITTVETEE